MATFWDMWRKQVGPRGRGMTVVMGTAVRPSLDHLFTPLNPRPISFYISIYISPSLSISSLSLPPQPYAFWGLNVVQSFCAFFLTISSMKTIPNPIFCTSKDPCSCKGGGFELYASVCSGRLDAATGNATNNTNNSTPIFNAQQAKEQYPTPFDTLASQGNSLFSWSR